MRILLLLAALILTVGLVACQDLGSTSTTAVSSTSTTLIASTTTTFEPTPQETIPTIPRVRVPDVVGWYLADAEAEIESSGLECEIHYVPDTALSGSVAAQNPAAGKKVSPGSTVKLDVLRYAYVLENLDHKYLAYVTQYCASNHLALEVEYGPCAPGDIGRVIAQDPSPGTLVMEGLSVVEVTIGGTEDPDPPPTI